MKFYKLEEMKHDDVGVWVTNLDSSGIVESVIQKGLHYITKEQAKKLGVQEGMRTDSIDKNELLEIAEFADAYLDDYINLENLQDDYLYFDDYWDTFYTKNDIKGLDSDKYILDRYGKNSMIKILAIAHIDVELIEAEKYQTGQVKTYESEFGTIKVDCSFYQGNWDEVVFGCDILEEKAAIMTYQ